MEKKHSRFKGIVDLLLMASNLLNVASDLARLISIEARLAGKSLITILVLAVMLSILLTTTWMCAQGLLFLYLVSLHWTWVAALFLLFVLNFLLVLFIAFGISHARKKLLFPITMRRCRHRGCTCCRDE